MDLQNVQTKLIHTVSALGEGDANVQVDWAGAPRSAAGNRPGVDFSAAVDALQWRSVQLGATPPAAATVAPEVCIKRLNAMAQKINHLSAEQERAIAEMQTIQAHLARLHPSRQGQGAAQAGPSVDVRRAALAAAEVDLQGNILLSYRTLQATPSPPQGSRPRPAPNGSDQLAAHLRVTYGPPGASDQGKWRTLVAEALTLGQEPSQLVTSLGHGIWQMVQGLTRFAVSGPGPAGSIPARETTSSLSFTDTALWFGGGVIGRLALNLLLAAFPSLWSVAVAAITAMTAYALYRATLAPKLAFGPALRVFLLVVGLVVGGQL